MQVPKKPANELRRLAAIAQYKLLDTLPEDDYDNITKLVSNICDVPISLITILDKDRNFFKSRYGYTATEAPRDLSFCAHGILDEKEIVIVNDARLDPRFADNPFVKDYQLIFYAGVRLMSANGYAFGSLCVFDHKPRELNAHQIDSLIILGKQVENLFELRLKNLRLESNHKDLVRRNIDLNNFASHVSHDLKSPLANIVALTSLLREDNLKNLSSDSSQYLGYIEDSATILKNYIDNILIYYKADEIVKAKKENVILAELYDELKQLLLSKNDELQYDYQGVIKKINKPALTQILINLIDNALKYNDSDHRVIHIAYEEDLSHHKFTVQDNGIGILKDKQEEIFALFKTIPKDGKLSTGIGLSTVKNLVDKLGGEISVKSELGKGSSFTFTIEK